MSQVHEDSALPSRPDYGDQFDTVEAQYAALARKPSTAVSEQADERALFEAWARRVGYEVDTFKAEEETTYSATFTNVAWEAWRARVATPASAQDAVVEANRRLLLERSNLGIQKYGTTLAGSGLSRRQLLQHALEEALDFANYLQAELMRE